MKVYDRKILWYGLAIMLSMNMVLQPMMVHGEEEMPTSLYAKSAVLMDAKSGRILFEKNGKTVLPMASTTKIMTCILALETAKENTMATASERAISMPKVKLGMTKGETFELKDLYYSLMLESHNDTAVAIAEAVSGSVEKFTSEMTKKAREIGCKNTTFLTPNGLDATRKEADGTEYVHSTTAEDLARILSYSITQSKKKNEFLKITQTRSYSFQDKSKKQTYTCTNHNAFLDQMKGAISGKTGFTAKAGYCYAGALEQNGKVYVVALLACGWPNHKQYKWSDTRKLMEYGLNKYRTVSFEEVKIQEKQLSPILIEEAKGESLNQKVKIPVVIKSEKNDTLDDTVLLKSGEKINLIVKTKKKLVAPVKKGQQVGTISYVVDGKIYKTEKIMLAQKAEKIDFLWCFQQVQKHFF